MERDYNWATGWFNCWHPSERKRVDEKCETCREPFFFYREVIRCDVIKRFLISHQHRQTRCDHNYSCLEHFGCSYRIFHRSSVLFKFYCQINKFGYYENQNFFYWSCYQFLLWNNALFVYASENVLLSATDFTWWRNVGEMHSESLTKVHSDGSRECFVIHPAFLWITNPSDLDLPQCSRVYFVPNNNKFFSLTWSWNQLETVCDSKNRLKTITKDVKSSASSSRIGFRYERRHTAEKLPWQERFSEKNTRNAIHDEFFLCHNFFATFCHYYLSHR